jgi:pimeloyl-ACP methyl ester carboxylesterase
MRNRIALVGILCSLFNGPVVLAQDEQAAQPPQPLGIALEGYPYPYPVQFLTFELWGELVRMAYMDVPAGSPSNGKVIVLMHGKNFDSSYWGGLAKALTANGYRTVIPDQIGFNKSSKPAIDYSFDLLAANTARLLDSLQIGKVALLGHSTGGMLAVHFAKLHPDRVTNLILEDPVGLEDYRDLIPAQTTERLFQDELQMTSQAYRELIKRYFVTWRPEFEAFARLRERIALSGEFPRWAKASALTYQMIYHHPVRAEYRDVKTPTLLIIGQQDRTVVMRKYASPDAQQKLGQYPKLAREAVKDLPHGELLELPQVGHLPHLEVPDRFTQAVLEFLRLGHLQN